MNPLAIVKLVQGLLSAKDDLKEEQEKFDQEVGVETSPVIKTAGHGALAGKALLLAMLAGDLPIADFFPAGMDMTSTLEWGAMIMAGGVGFFGMLKGCDSADKEDQRIKGHTKQAIVRQKEEAKANRLERQRRKDSPYLPDY